MRIERPRRNDRDGWARLEATAIWEEQPKDPVTIFFEVPETYGSFLSDSADCFLASCSTLAALAGEKRLFVERADLELADRIETAMGFLALWSPELFTPVPIDVDPYARPVDSAGKIAGSLLSGGIDSLALLRSNHMTLPVGHPGRIGASVTVNWNAGCSTPNDQAAYDSMELRSERLRPVIQETGIGHIRLYSNVMGLLNYPRAPLWGRVIHGIAFGGAAHALSGGFHTVLIGSGFPIESLKPFGSHPLIDNELSSTSLRFMHSGLKMTRSDKTALVADWPTGLSSVSVCVGPYEERVAKGNCGECQKCLRTALMLLSLGRLDAASTFRSEDTTPEAIKNVPLSVDRLASYVELSVALRAAGEEALAAAIDRRVRRLWWKGKARSTAKAIDRVFLGGRIKDSRSVQHLVLTDSNVD